MDGEQTDRATGATLGAEPRGPDMEANTMLALTRKRGERIVIGGNIVVEVVEIRGDKVKLGIEAPREITVYREEVAAAIAQQHDLGGEA